MRCGLWEDGELCGGALERAVKRECRGVLGYGPAVIGYGVGGVI